MWNDRSVVLPRLTVMLATLLLGFASPRSLWAQANLEDPGPGSRQSGIALIRGWVCQAILIEIQIDEGPRLRAAYGTTRGDTQGACGDDNNGFGLTWNWNLSGDGLHRVRAFADGVLFADVTFTVTTLGGEFLQGLSGGCTVPNFPQAGNSVDLVWQESIQNFVIVKGNGGGSGNPGDGSRLLEDPGPGSRQSGIALIRGWVCQAILIEIQIDEGPRLRAAYGTTRGDTQGACGDDNNGFGLTWNWNLSGDGLHRVRAFADGVLFADVTFTVTTLGGEFLQGLSGGCTVPNFPQAGNSVDLVWQESIQNFVIVSPFTQGVASGDVMSSSVVLWTRSNQEATLTVEVSTDSTFQTPTLTQTALAAASNDFTTKTTVSPLQPGLTYFYRWRQGSAVSEVGTFKTAPLPSVPVNLRFAFSGDSDGSKVAGVPFYNNFEALDAARLEGLDFFVYLGDTVYADFRGGGLPNAQTLAEYRGLYKENREIAALRNLLKATSTYAIWDDHEVRNDWDGQTVDQTFFTIGRQSFLEYLPLSEANLPSDPTCAGPPLFRVFHWGRDADIIILDERSCRSADVEAVCSFTPGSSDLAPTLPTNLRPSFGLPSLPPPDCLAAISDPSRTLLGSVQKQLFKNALLSSTAKFKFVINEVPIQQLYALPYDRWEGYDAERTEILNFIRDNNIRNVIFLTTDLHANGINQVFIDNFADPSPIAEEFVTGPVATTTLQESTLSRFGPTGLTAINGLISIVEVDCRHLDAFSYGVVDVNTSAGTATITLKDDAGAVLVDQQNPAVQCVKTIGP